MLGIDHLYILDANPPTFLSMESSLQNNPAASRVAIIGGGAAGFFAALAIKDSSPATDVSIYEKSNQYLTKVRISGGGRCNATHECFDPSHLAKFYPRGSKELRGAFYRWQPLDTINWFSARNVDLKAEPDGRMFPTTDQSQTIIDCFMNEAHQLGVRLFQKSGVRSIKVNEDKTFTIQLSSDDLIVVDAVCIAIGSLKQSPMAKSLEYIGHRIEALAPSLFAFNIQDSRIQGLAGLSVQNVKIQVLGSKKVQTGPLLITHKGLSGPADLKTSAWEARVLKSKDYKFQISVNWMGSVSDKELREQFSELRTKHGKNKVRRSPFPEIPRRLWDRFISPLKFDPELVWAQFPKDKENSLIADLSASIYEVRGKTTNKEIEEFVDGGQTAKHYPEFVTCGGISLKEVDFRRMESKLIPNLHFAGECLDIDGVTGGFNFQSCWTTGKIAGEAIAKRFAKSK